jgi:hypothetical protein
MKSSLAMPTDEITGTVHAVECTIDDVFYALPSSEVERIIECEVGPVPLVHQHVVGLAVHDGEIILLLRVHDASPPSATGHAEPSRRTRAALLIRRGDGPRWAVEIGEVHSIVALRNPGEPNPNSPWLTSAETQSGRSIQWVDVSRLRQLPLHANHF